MQISSNTKVMSLEDQDHDLRSVLAGLITSITDHTDIKSSAMTDLIFGITSWPIFTADFNWRRWSVVRPAPDLLPDQTSRLLPLTQLTFPSE